jgi:hypothetical protein
MPSQESRLRSLWETFPIALEPIEWRQTISSDGRRRITLRASRPKSGFLQTRILLSTGHDLADLPITVEIVPLSDLSQEIGALWYEPALKTDDGVVDEPDRIFGAFGLSNSVFDELWLRIRSIPRPSAHLVISTDPLDTTSGMFEVRWDVTEKKRLKISSVELSFARAEVDSSPIPGAVADVIRSLDDIRELLASVVKRLEHKISFICGLLITIVILVFLELGSREISNFWGKLALWPIAIGLGVYLSRRFEGD